MMLIKDGKLIKSDGNLKKFIYDTYEVNYIGFIYTNNSPNEEDSIKELLFLLKKNKPIDYNLLKGIFLLYIKNKINGDTLVFSDNSGMYTVFTHENVISTSFLELIEYLNISISDLDYRSINEFLHLGFVHSNNTFIRSIKKMKYSNVIIWKNGEKKIVNKNLMGLDENNYDFSFEKHFDIFSNSIKQNNISVDLTGGIDSRLICALLDYRHLDFEVAISGVKGNQDIEIAKRVSKLLNKEFFVTYHSIDELTDSKIQDIFKITDAQINVLNYHRNIQFNKDKQSRGVNFQISGAAGELYKDYWWLQDFPLYRNRISNIKKLYSLRIESISFPHEIMGRKVYDHSIKFKNNSINNLKRYKMDYNTQTYDKIYYYFKMQTVGSTYLTIPTNNFVTTYAPLMERELVRKGFNLSRLTRFYSNFHRKQISKVNRKVSQIVTTEGVSCSDNLISKTCDIPKYLVNKQKRIFKQIYRKIGKTTLFQDNPSDLKIFEIVKNLDLINEQDRILKQHGVLSKENQLGNLKSEYMGRFITVGLFIKYLS